MAVAFDARSSGNCNLGMWDTNYATGGVTIAGFQTVGASATCLWVAVEVDTTTVGAWTVTWDSAGTAQVMTQVGSNISQGGGSALTLAQFVLVNPTTGTKNLKIVGASIAGAPNMYVAGASFTGTATASVAAATEGAATANDGGTTGTTASVTTGVSIPSGDMAVAGFVIDTAGSISSTNGTNIGICGVLTNNAAAAYYSGGGGTITGTATSGAAAHWAAAIVGIKAPASAVVEGAGRAPIFHVQRGPGWRWRAPPRGYVRKNGILLKAA